MNNSKLVKLAQAERERQSTFRSAYFLLQKYGLSFSRCRNSSNDLGTGAGSQTKY